MWSIIAPFPCPLAGLPGFIHEPEDLNVTRNTNFTLTCVARGPPEPVSIRWFNDGKPVEGKEEEMSPSRLTVEGKPRQHAVQPVCFIFLWDVWWSASSCSSCSLYILSNKRFNMTAEYLGDSVNVSKNTDSDLSLSRLFFFKLEHLNSAFI